MILLSYIECKTCKNKHFEFCDEIKDDSNILQNRECSHFSIYSSINIKNQKFDKYTLTLICKICQKMHIQPFTGYLYEPYKYQCLNCKAGSISFFYELSDKFNDKFNQKRYKTPGIINKDTNDKKKINIKIVYNFKTYNFVFYSNDKIKDKYDEIRNKIGFPDGKKIFFNYNEVDMTKSFEENKLINEMKLLIQD